MRIPIFRAKAVDSDKVYEGFYFAMPETTYCFTEDYCLHPVKIQHYLIVHTMTDWNLPNEIMSVLIDPTTLEKVGHVHSSYNNFVPGEWIKYIGKHKMTRD